MQKLWIFGDSHVDPKSNYKEYKHIRTNYKTTMSLNIRPAVFNVYSEKTGQYYDTDCLTYEGWVLLVIPKNMM